MIWYDKCVQDLERDYEEGLVSYTEYTQEMLTLDEAKNSSQRNYKQAKLGAAKRSTIKGEFE